MRWLDRGCEEDDVGFFDKETDIKCRIICRLMLCICSIVDSLLPLARREMRMMAMTP